MLSYLHLNVGMIDVQPFNLNDESKHANMFAGRFFTIWAPGTLRVDDKTSKILYRYHFERLVKKPLGHALFPLVKYFYNYTAQCRLVFFLSLL